MYNGVINIYKEEGYTSHDVVAKMRGILKQKKIGHTGTLDPDAVGVLPVCLGNATKLCDMLTDREKEYIACMRLGVITDTQDMSGTVLEDREVSINEEEITEIINSFVGGYGQIPPMYSAIKVDGKRLYELARQGKVVERQPRNIILYEIEILNIKLPDITFRVVCSKGTYIRTLCHDIGVKAGCGGAMVSLIRSRSGRFTMDTAITLKQLEQIRDEDKLDDAIILVDKMFEGLTDIHVQDIFTKLVENGNSLSMGQILEQNKFKDGQEVKVYSRTGQFFGIYKYEEGTSRFVPRRMFLGS